MSRVRECELINKLARPAILDLIPYASARKEFAGKAKIFLDANENTLGSSVNYPEICRDLNRYPDPIQIQLRSKIAKIVGSLPEQVFVGNGSDEAIDLLIRVFCQAKKDKILITPPTYAMYEVIANIQGVGLQRVALSPQFQLDLNKVKSAINKKTKIIFICSPNNPTANSVPFKLIKEIATSFNGILVVDEAYIDFSEEKSALTLINKYPKVVVLRTMSKAWGLAGIRVGFAFAHPQVIKLMQKIKAPYNVSSLAQVAALKALSSRSFLKRSILEIKRERKRLCQLLPLSPDVVKVYRSDASFLLVKFKNAQKSFDKLMLAGIIVRDRSKTSGCDNCLRIAIGSSKENDVLLLALGIKLNNKLA